MSPQWPYLVLSADVPDIELDIFICDCLDIEPDCWNSCDVLIQLELVENCCKVTLVLEDIGRRCRWQFLLVFPAASSPSMRSRISLEPKSLPMIFETCPPMVFVCLYLSLSGSS